MICAIIVRQRLWSEGEFGFAFAGFYFGMLSLGLGVVGALVALIEFLVLATYSQLF